MNEVVIDSSGFTWAAGVWPVIISKPWLLVPALICVRGSSMPW